jgi:amino-acid N-acetyltransferase
MIRKAKIKDIQQIQELIGSFAKLDIMLPRSLNELYENIRDFWVYEDKGKLSGCGLSSGSPGNGGKKNLRTYL